MAKDESCSKNSKNPGGFFGSMVSSRRNMVALISLLVVIGLVAFLVGTAIAQNRTLYWGSRGNDVVQVQQRLQSWGYYNGPVDGYYGAKTWAAVKKFQARNGLLVDGIVGERTWAALGLLKRPSQQNYTVTTTAARGAVSSRDSINLLARVIEGEAADEPFLGKVAVGAVILNRVKSSSFPNTLSGVIYQPLAFESVSNGQIWRTLSTESLRAAEYAFSGWDPTHGALFFWNPYKRVSAWIWSRNIITQIGRHVFAL